mmetsp:Transcript_36925/g.89051  ORF Transcript_36925/g.89051 Transcript_36925/m.89051 type:complete len:83 (+) Transcript_36925:115-363(+)
MQSRCNAGGNNGQSIKRKRSLCCLATILEYANHVTPSPSFYSSPNESINNTAKCSFSSHEPLETEPRPHAEHLQWPYSPPSD